jgi:DNA anti-recombination protein RmuC
VRIEEHALEIQALLAGLGKDMKAFQEEFRVVGKHITDARNRFDEARARLDALGFKLEQIEHQPGVTPLEQAEPPACDEQ